MLWFLQVMFFLNFLCFWKIEWAVLKWQLLYHPYLLWILQMSAFQVLHEEKLHRCTRISSMNFWESSFLHCNYELLKTFLHFPYVGFPHAWARKFFTAPCWWQHFLPRDRLESESLARLWILRLTLKQCWPWLTLSLFLSASSCIHQNLSDELSAQM